MMEILLIVATLGLMFYGKCYNSSFPGMSEMYKQQDPRRALKEEPAPLYDPRGKGGVQEQYGQLERQALSESKPSP